MSFSAGDIGSSSCAICVFPNYFSVEIEMVCLSRTHVGLRLAEPSVNCNNCGRPTVKTPMPHYARAYMRFMSIFFAGNYRLFLSSL